MSELLPGLAAGGGFVLFLTVVSWSLAHLAKRLPESIPRLAKILVCGTAAQLAFLVAGFVLFVEQDFVDWLLTRPMRAYFLTPGTLVLGCLAAWSVLRDREKVDIEVFE